MGEVYLAKDPRLDREVAIKILPEPMARDQERVLRFEREAKLLASLNHSNIAQIYGFEESGEQKFLVLEYVQGETLAARLKRGPVPVDETLELGGQIARALEAAHEKGVIHRDLKPGNVMITPGGKVKVLDFGLACAMTADCGPSGTSHDSPTLTDHSPAITADFTLPGVVLGTAAYMSPEQARGRQVDKRSDIWSFGVLLYECLTGQSLFSGETATDTMGAILHRDPVWSALPGGTPPTIRHLLRRCLQKDRNRRLHDIADARIEIEEAIAEPTHSALDPAMASPVTRGGRSRLSLALIPLALIAVALIAAFTAWQLKPRAVQQQPQLRKLEILVDGLRPDEHLKPVISPDGSRIAYVADGSLWVRSLDDLQAVELTGTEGARKPFWSPDSSQVGFHDGSHLWRMPASGGARTMICVTAQSLYDRGGATWTANGRVLFTTAWGGPIWEVPAGGGEPRVALRPDPDRVRDFHFASELPDGSGILSVLHRAKGEGDIANTIVLIRNDSFKILLVHEEEELFAPVYASGHIVYGRAQMTGTIWAAPFSLESQTVTGPSFLVADSAGLPSVSRDGTLVYGASTLVGTGQLVWVDRAGTITAEIGKPQQGLIWPVVSPDGTRVAAQATETGAHQIWIHELARGSRRPFPTAISAALITDWVSDDHLAYTNGSMTQIRSVTRSEPPTLLVNDDAMTISADGRYTATEHRIGDSIDIYYSDLQQGGEPLRLVASEATEVDPAFRPSGGWLAFSSNETGRNEVYLVRFPSGEDKRQISIDGGTNPHWSRTSDELFYQTDRVDGAELMFVKFTGRDLQLTEPQRLFSEADANINLERGWDVSSDGQRILGVRDVTTESDTRRITVVENWYQEFEKP